MGAILRVAIAVIVLASAVACDTMSSPTAPTAAAVDPSLIAALTRAIDDEYRAEAIYQGVLNDFGQIMPFVNVLTAEERHSTAIARLFTNRGLAVPTSTSTVGTVPHFDSVSVACAAGVVAERENIALYDDLLRGELPSDARQVFTNNRSASLLNHLPAFMRCS